jgi:hypothetical protein
MRMDLHIYRLVMWSSGMKKNEDNIGIKEFNDNINIANAILRFSKYKFCKEVM